MAIYPLMRTRRRFWLAEPPDAVIQSLADAVSDGELTGSAGLSFTLRVPRSNQNSWRPVLNGTLRPVSGGTLVEVQAAVLPAVFIFTVVHGFLLLGIAWMIGIGAFSSEADTALAALQDAAGDTGAAMALPDPLEDGAEALAPWSLDPAPGMDGVRFTLHSRRNRLGRQKQTTLLVTRAGVTVGETELPWHVVAEGRLDGAGTLCLGALRIDTFDHERSHLDWLVAYLHGKAAQLGANEDERSAFVRNAQRLAAMQQAPKP